MMIEYFPLIFALWMAWELSSIPAPSYFVFKYFQDEHRDLESLMRYEGSSLEDVPSFTPKDMDREIEYRKKIRSLKRMSEVKSLD